MRHADILIVRYSAQIGGGLIPASAFCLQPNPAESNCQAPLDRKIALLIGRSNQRFSHQPCARESLEHYLTRFARQQDEATRYAGLCGSGGSVVVIYCARL